MASAIMALLLLSACASSKSAMPDSGEKTAAKKAPDFSQKEVNAADGHVIKYEGGHGGGFVRSYKNGKKDGISAFYRNGVLYAKKSYKNGILHGWSRNYYFPFALTDIYYVDGEKHGVAKEWCDGRKKLKLKEHYVHGKLDGLSEKWNCDGRHYLMHSIAYKNGKKDGICRTYDSWNFKNGKLFSVETYKNGKKNGVSKQYHSNGKLCCLNTYKNGILEGESKFWDHEGKLRTERIYRNGRAFDMNGNYIPTIKEKD